MYVLLLISNIYYIIIYLSGIIDYYVIPFIKVNSNIKTLALNLNNFEVVIHNLFMNKS